jgi:hypothetical protein
MRKNRGRCFSDAVTAREWSDKYSPGTGGDGVQEEEGSRMALMAVLERQRHEDKMCNQCEARAFMADGSVCVCDGRDGPAYYSTRFQPPEPRDLVRVRVAENGSRRRIEVEQK